jgi:hypothetical protein
LPAAAAPEASLGAARQRYLAADVEGCLALVADDALVDRALARGDRAGAARLLLWRVACRVAGEQRALAERDAAELAAFGLSVPPDARDVSPDIENLLDRAVQRAANARGSELEVSVDVPRATVRLDGRDATCTAPCVMRAPNGVHVVSASADGARSVTRRVTLEGAPKRLTISLPKAPPDVAADQWRSRYESTSEEQSAESARLLSVAVPARYLVLLSRGETSSGERLRGLLYFDGGVRARAESVGSAASRDDAPAKVLSELLHESKLFSSTPLLKSPWFWTAAVGTAVLASVATYFAVRSPDERTEVRLR